MNASPNKRHKLTRHSVFAVAAILFAACVSPKAQTNVKTTSPAENTSPLKLPGLFSDNMVLQQGTSVPVWGWAAEGETVTVTFRDQKISTKVKRGKWRINLRNMRAGGPDALTVSSGRTIQFTNVLVGEVWVCSGQSNMGRPLQRSFQPEADIASATNSMIRLFVVPKVKADAPLDNVGGSWQLCSPETAAGFSAVGYYFGSDLQWARQVPLGLIESDWGGTPAAPWISWTALEANPRLKAEIIDTFPAARKKRFEDMAAYEAAKEEAKKKQKEFNKRAPYKSWRPGELYNGMIAPLMPFAIKGVIWYQGEANVSRAHQYRELFPALIRDWRRNWGQGDFPFLCVQLAPFKEIKQQPAESALAELREAQLRTTKALPRTGLAVITDVGDEKDIHPAKKVPVGARLALAARGIAYGEKIVYSGPVYKSMRIQEAKAILSFDHVGSGLKASDALKGFSICGPDRKFFWAQAEIRRDNTVTVWSSNVSEPVAVRYGWADYPVVNLWNKDGLPASPFRTDNFPMLTWAATMNTTASLLVAAQAAHPRSNSADQKEAPQPQVKVVPNGESSTRPEDCRGIIVGPGINQPDPFPGYAGFVGWESPIRLKNGDWLVGFNAGYWHASVSTPMQYSPKNLEEYRKMGMPTDIVAPTGGRAMITRSTNEGKTWNKPETLIDTPADDRHPAFVQLRDGTVLCCFFIYLGDEPEAPGKVPPPHVFFIRSFDGGKTWEKMPRPLGTPHFHETDGPFAKLKDGSVLLAINGRPQGPPDQAGIFRSTNRGRTWKLLSTVKANHDLQEVTVTELRDGRWVMMARPEGDISWSSDRGRTWTPPVTFGMRMFAPSLSVLRNGTLVCLHGSYAPGHPGQRVIFSADGGQTWIAPAKDHGFLVDNSYGYGKAMELPDGSLFISYLATGGHRTTDAQQNAIRCIRLRVRADHSGIELLPAPNR